MAMTISIVNPKPIAITARFSLQSSLIVLYLYMLKTTSLISAYAWLLFSGVLCRTCLK